MSAAFAWPRRFVLLARDFLLAVPVVVIAAPLWLLPWRAALALGAFYGRCAFFLWPVAGVRTTCSRSSLLIIAGTLHRDQARVPAKPSFEPTL